ncbi:MAG: DUF1232 domain-containing protein [Clostridia bacterium]|nr:DUF1232 domain-containing protein [Clostridia bacterium]
MNEKETNTNKEFIEEIGEVLHDKGINSEMIQEQIEESRKKAEDVLRDKGKAEKILKKAKWLCAMLSNVPVVGTFFENAGVMCDIVSDYLKGEYNKIPIATIATLLGGLIYFVAPIDLLPDALPFIGALDDTAVLYMIGKAAKNDIAAYKEWKGIFVPEEDTQEKD